MSRDTPVTTSREMKVCRKSCQRRICRLSYKDRKTSILRGEKLPAAMASQRLPIFSRRVTTIKSQVRQVFFWRAIWLTCRYLVVTLGRFELPTCGLGNRRSIHLSYRAIGRNRSYCLSLLHPKNPSVLFRRRIGQARGVPFPHSCYGAG
jgi:hypothetical protein